MGQNCLQAVAGVPPWKILLAQLSSVVVALLIAAAIIAALMGDGLDAAAIAAVRAPDADQWNA